MGRVGTQGEDARIEQRLVGALGGDFGAMGLGEPVAGLGRDSEFAGGGEAARAAGGQVSLDRVAVLHPGVAVDPHVGVVAGEGPAQEGAADQALETRKRAVPRLGAGEVDVPAAGHYHIHQIVQLRQGLGVHADVDEADGASDAGVAERPQHADAQLGQALIERGDDQSLHMTSSLSASRRFQAAQSATMSSRRER